MAELTADTKDEEINSNGLLNGRTGLLVKIVPELHNKVILNYVKCLYFILVHIGLEIIFKHLEDY